MKRLFIVAAWILTLAGCTSKLIVRPVTGPIVPGSDNEGVFYALPKTVLLIEVPVVRTQLVLGEFSELVPVFFPFEEPPVADTSYSLDEPTLSSFGVPDRDHVFLAVVKGGRFEDKKLALNFGDDGTIEKIDAESTNRTLEFIGQVIRSGAAIGGRLLLPGPSLQAKSAKTLDASGNAVNLPLAQTCRDIENLLKGGATVTTDTFPAIASAACNLLEDDLQTALKNYIAKESDVSKRATQARTFLRAKDAAQRLTRLRSNRESFFIAGNVGSGSGDPLKTSLDALNAEIDGILGQFFGTEAKKTYWKAAYQLTPTSAFVENSQAQTIELFTYSPEAGICQEPGSQGALIDRLEQLPPPSRTASCTKWVKVEVVVARPPRQYADAVTAATATPPAGERGFFYRVPSKARVLLQIRKSTDSAVSARAQYSPSVGQFGPIVSLPATSGGRRTQYVSELHSATGAMKSFTLGSEAALDKSFVTDIEAGATSLLDARQKRLEAQQKRQDALDTRNDELTKLKREADVLETQVRIKAAQDKLAPATKSPE